MKTLPNDLKAWVRLLSTTEIPVLKSTAREIERLKQDEDNVTARDITSVCIRDPMMTFKILRYMQTHKRSNQLQDLVLVEQAIMMMGLGTFFKNLPPNPIVEDSMKTNLTALTYLLKLIHRINRAAIYAFEFGMMQNDLHLQETRIAALLHDLTEVLLWCFAPEKMMEIKKIQQADKTVRSASAQEQVFGFKFSELQIALVNSCQLPPLLAKLMDEHCANETRVRTVILAGNVARHSANGWDDAALPDDYTDIARHLRIDVEKAKRIVGVPALTA